LLISAWFPIVPEYVKYVADQDGHRWQYFDMYSEFQDGIRGEVHAVSARLV
jgi:hypothetical protein